MAAAGTIKFTPSISMAVMTTIPDTWEMDERTEKWVFKNYCRSPMSVAAWWGGSSNKNVARIREERRLFVASQKGAYPPFLFYWIHEKGQMISTTIVPAKAIQNFARVKNKWGPFSSLRLDQVTHILGSASQNDSLLSGLQDFRAVVKRFVHSIS